MKTGGILLAGAVLLTGCSNLGELFLPQSEKDEQLMQEYFEAAMNALEQGDAAERHLVWHAVGIQRNFTKQRKTGELRYNMLIFSKIP